MENINIEHDWKWSSHQPMIHLMMSMFHPNYVLELGMGINSTPIFLSYNPEKYVGVENDNNWLDYLKSLYNFNNHTILLHDLGPDITISTQYKEIKDTPAVDSIKTYYSELAERVKLETGLKLLFVDQFTGIRFLSMMVLGDLFDIIIYHDCEPLGIDIYDYYFPKEFTELFNSCVLKNGSVWTGCFLKKSIVFPDLNNRIQPFIQAYLDKNSFKPWHHVVTFEKNG